MGWVLNTGPGLPTDHEIYHNPTVQEVRDAVECLKCDKAPGTDGTPAEVFTCAGEDLLNHHTGFFQRCLGCR